MLVRTVCICGLIGALANEVMGVAIITYESYDDLTPASADILLGAPGSGSESATIDIWIASTEGQQWSMGAGGFTFDGTDHGDGSVTSPDGGMTSSDYHWADVFQDPNEWFTIDTLPTPQTVKFFPPGVPIPEDGLYLGSLTITANAVGSWNQPTNPVGFLKSDPGGPPPLDKGSDFFTVTVVPEPAGIWVQAVLGALMICRRK